MHARKPVLGIDAGGTATRWALVMPDKKVLAQGETAPLSGIIRTDSEQEQMRHTLEALSRTIAAHAQPQAIAIGMTGLGNDETRCRWFVEHLLAALDTPPAQVFMMGDLLFAYLSCIRPGKACMVYAGTGSVAVYIDVTGEMHRAGGRGSLLDDAGAGYWIAREALRLIWRREDERPGCWEQSPMARRLFAALGGSSWDCSREFVYQRDRGATGRLALQVAESAADDPLAALILQQAGIELARLGNIMVRRFGPLPIVLSGRAASLHPLIHQSMLQHMDTPVPVSLHPLNAHVDCAALLAAAEPDFVRALQRHTIHRPLTQHLHHDPHTLEPSY